MARNALFALALAAAASQAHAANEPALAGITLRERPQLDECPERQRSYLADDRTTCFELPSGPAPSGEAASIPANGRIMVNVALADRPSFMQGGDAMVTLRDGRVQSVAVRTHGAGQDSADLRALEDRFGRTSPRYLSTAQRFESYSNIRADWRLDGAVTVYFSSTELGRYSGIVRMQTPEAPPHQVGQFD
ncbi:hypothetical protein [Dyella ginsengisoli]|uniref:hypothetical protein n=1 Tax=Dyella ginsengisoli TaxID=363848 RepID=UPI00034BB3C2|nr:hypothetical protein [Dyella ginsengisoli]